eukprot:9474828-Pyramimonas_sp.AAC.1
MPQDTLRPTPLPVPRGPPQFGAPRPPLSPPLCGRALRVNLGLLDGVEAAGVGGSRRIADASAMRLDVEPDLLHVDVA